MLLGVLKIQCTPVVSYDWSRNMMNTATCSYPPVPVRVQLVLMHGIHFFVILVEVTWMLICFDNRSSVSITESVTPMEHMNASYPWLWKQLMEMLQLQLWNESSGEEQVISHKNWGYPNPGPLRYFMMMSFMHTTTCGVHVSWRSSVGGAILKMIVIAAHSSINFHACYPKVVHSPDGSKTVPKLPMGSLASILWSLPPLNATDSLMDDIPTLLVRLSDRTFCTSFKLLQMIPCLALFNLQVSWRSLPNLGLHQGTLFLLLCFL